MQQSDKPDTNKVQSTIGSPNTPENFVEGAGIGLEDVKVGHALEAASFDGKWYYGKIVYVDESDETFLVHFDGWNTRFDEWYKYASKKVRPLPPNTDQNRKKATVFKPGENVLAKWIDNKYYMCHVVRTRPGDKYEVRFEDGVFYTVEASKVRIADKIDEVTESTRLLKQQETIERAKSREVRLQRRSKIHNDSTFLSPSMNTSTHSVAISEMTNLEDGLCLPVSISLSEVYLNSSEKDEDTPFLTLYPGKTYSVRSFSAVLGPDLEYLAEADSDVTSTAPSTPLSLSGSKDLSLRKRRDPPILSPALNTSTHDDMPESDTVTRTQSIAVSHPSPPPPPSANPKTQDPQPVTQPLLLPLTQTSPPILSTYTPSIPYTETVVTADGRVLTLTPSSYQPAPPPAPVPDVTNQPLYYQLVPIQVNPPSNPPNIPVDQSYLTIQQPYSYPYQTQYAPIVQQYSSSLPPPPSSLLPSHSLALSTSLQATPAISLPTNTQLIQDTAYATQIHTMDVQPQEVSSYLDQLTQQSHNPSLQVYQSIESQHRDDVRLHSDHSTEQADYVISDSESDKVLFIDTQSADQHKSDVTSRARKNSLSEEDIENRELRKLRLPDHNRKVAPRELVTTLESELFVCKRAGCKKEFHRRESLKKHMRVFHGSSLDKKMKSIEKPQPKPSKLSPMCSPVSTPEPIPNLQPNFPSSSDHSITHTELLFQDPVSSHRSKRKSSQPRKSSFPVPTTPTVTIVIPSDPSEVASPPKTPPLQTTAPPVTTNPTVPSRHSKRISIKKNLDFDTNYKTVRKNPKLKDKLDRQEALKKDVRTLFSNPRLQQEVKEKATLKMKPPQQYIEPLSAVQSTELSAQTPLEEVPQEKDSNDVTDHMRDVDVESVELVEEIQTDLSVNSPIGVIDLMETNDIEISESKQEVVTESSNLEVDLNSENKSNNYSSGSEIDDDVSLEDTVTPVNPQELIRCVCDQDKDEGVMVQCEQCMTWQHTSCLGLSEKDLPDQHICSECSDPPASIKREQYKHCNPWYHSGKIMFPTDTELVETGAHLTSLKNQLATLENMIPSVNLKIQIAKNGDHPHLKEFLSTSCNVLTPAEIEDKLVSLSYLTNSQTEIHEKCTESTDNKDNSTPDVTSDNDITLASEEQIQHTQPVSQPQTEATNKQDDIPADTVDPNLTSLLIALNDSTWGCEMRLFDNIEKIQNNILDRFSSIEMELNSLRYRIPDSDVSSLTDTLSKLDSIRTCLS